MFLALAYNSSRLFAAVERAVFSTPYRHGRIRVNTGLPGSIALFDGPDAVLGVAMAHDGPASCREPIRVGDDGWEGPVFLPGHGRRPESIRQVVPRQGERSHAGLPVPAGERSG